MILLLYTGMTTIGCALWPWRYAAWTGSLRIGKAEHATALVAPVFVSSNGDIHTAILSQDNGGPGANLKRSQSSQFGQVCRSDKTTGLSVVIRLDYGIKGRLVKENMDIAVVIYRAGSYL